MTRLACSLTILTILTAMCGCADKLSRAKYPIGPPVWPDYDRPLPPGRLALRKLTDPSRIPDFSQSFANQHLLRQAAQHSLDYLARPSSQRFFPYGRITHRRAIASLHELLALLDDARTPEQFNRLLRRRFDVYMSVGCDDRGTVLFTGYYCPIFDARLQPDQQYRYPLYRLPPDLLRDSTTGMTLGRRKPPGDVVPYYTRAQIDRSDLLDGNELAWLADPFETYVVSVQGSARLRLADGSIMEIGFAGDNGHDYVSVALALVEDGEIARSELSLDTMIAYFKQNPSQLDVYLPCNPRYVFFKQITGGPYGCLNVPVLAMRSIATDKDIYPRACLTYLDTTVARDVGGSIEQVPYRGFALDQDRGNAIRAAGRCDIFMGVGPHAGRIAGTSEAEGKLYYLFCKWPPRTPRSPSIVSADPPEPAQ